MKDFKTTRFVKRIAITDDDHVWILQNKGKKSATGFLEEVIKEYKLTFKKNENPSKRV